MVWVHPLAIKGLLTGLSRFEVTLGCLTRLRHVQNVHVDILGCQLIDLRLQFLRYLQSNSSLISEAVGVTPLRKYVSNLVRISQFLSRHSRKSAFLSNRIIGLICRLKLNLLWLRRLQRSLWTAGLMANNLTLFYLLSGKVFAERGLRVLINGDLFPDWADRPPLLE